MSEQQNSNPNTLFQADPAEASPAETSQRELEGGIDEEQYGLGVEQTEKGETGSINLDRIMDIPLVVSVELGRTQIVVGDLLQLAQGSVVELSKLAGEPLDVLVHGKLMARGEAVLINDQFGVRLTDIVSPTERINSLSS